MREQIAHRLRPTHVALLLILASYADWTTGEARPSQKTLGVKLGLDRGLVARLLKQLQAEGLIEHVRDHPSQCGRAVKVRKLIGYDRFVPPSAPTDYVPQIGREQFEALLPPPKLRAPAQHEQKHDHHPEQEQHPYLSTPASPPSNLDSVVAPAAVAAETGAEPTGVRPITALPLTASQQVIYELLIRNGIDDCKGMATRLARLDRDPAYVRRVIHHASKRATENRTGWIVDAVSHGGYGLSKTPEEAREEHEQDRRKADARHEALRREQLEGTRRIEARQAEDRELVAQLDPTLRERYVTLALGRYRTESGDEAANFASTRSPDSPLIVGLIAEEIRRERGGGTPL